MHEKEQQAKRKQSVNAVSYTPYCTILKQCLPQCFNVFFVFFVTLTIFPAVHSGELQILTDFMVNKNCFVFCSSLVSCIKWDIWNMGRVGDGFIHSFDWKVHFEMSSWLRNLEGSSQFWEGSTVYMDWHFSGRSGQEMWLEMGDCSILKFCVIKIVERIENATSVDVTSCRMRQCVSLYWPVLFDDD